MAGRSAGLLPYRLRGGEPEVLIGHMGGPYWAKKQERAWSIVKGEVEEGEDEQAAALREFAEETGAPAPAGELHDLGEARQAGGKTVRAWALAGEQLDVQSLRSNSFELEWPPRSGRTASFPELDRFQWCPLARAAELLVAGQQPLLARLAELLAEG
jgi:predicted NUDIX family NTP pyrophosphohydrolase